LCRCAPNYVWTGLFTYDEPNSQTAENLLKAVKRSKSTSGAELNCSCFGSHLFLRGNRTATEKPDAVAWITYKLDGLAPSYFIGNLIGHLRTLGSLHTREWFPLPERKTSHATYKITEGDDEPYALSND